MKYLSFLVALSTIWSVLSCSNTATPQNSQLPARKILFIGNSFTDYNGGLDTLFRGLATNAQTSRIAPGGTTLQNHADDLNTANAIKNRNWDYVVMQEQSEMPVVNRDYFLAGATSLNDIIKTTNAKALLFMTWARPDRTFVTTAALAESYDYVGAQIGVPVAHVGLAFAAALQARPGLILNSSDGHPTPEGSYLAACVFYGVIFNKSPVGNTFTGGISSDSATFLQGIAASQLGL